MNLRRWVNKSYQFLNPGVLVLMYHRVAEPTVDPWQLAVSLNNFEQQLQVLKKTGLVVPLSDLEEALVTQRKLRPAIVITFDDGYVDNYLHAKPLLEKYGLPATFFICTHPVEAAQKFWWDELAQLLLLTKALPSSISLQINDAPFTFDLSEETKLTGAMYREHKVWNAYQTPTTRRELLYLQLWRLLSPLAYGEQQHVIQELKQRCIGLEQTEADFHAFPMSEAQLLSMASDSLFSLGAHTRDHPLLSGLGKEIQESEINNSKYFLEALTGKEITAFAYPSGNYNDNTITLLNKLGFRVAFTTDHKAVKRGEDPLRLGRFQVNNWSGIEFSEILSNWFR